MMALCQDTLLTKTPDVYVGPDQNRLFAWIATRIEAPDPLPLIGRGRRARALRASRQHGRRHSGRARLHDGHGRALRVRAGIADIPEG